MSHLNNVFLYYWGHCRKAGSLWYCGVVTKQFPSRSPGSRRAPLDSLPWKSPVTLQTFHKSAEWLRWSINTLWIGPSGKSGHIRNSKKPKPRVHCEFCSNNTVDLVQWKMGCGPKTIIAAIVLVVTWSFKCNIQEGHFITSNTASIMCEICSLNGLAIISINSGYSGSLMEAFSSCGLFLSLCLLMLSQFDFILIPTFNQGRPFTQCWIRSLTPTCFLKIRAVELVLLQEGNQSVDLQTIF